MNKTITENRPKFFLLSWIIIPLLAVWLTTNYIVGSLRRPTWESKFLEKNINVSGFSESDLTEKEPRAQYKWNGEGLVTIWFDDAWISQYEPAFQILEGFGYKAALAVVTDNVGYPSYMSWDHIRVLENKGWEITSHSKSHYCNISELSKSQLEEEIINSNKELVSKSFDIAVYVAPCGTISEESLNLIENNFTALRTVNAGFENIPVENKYAIKSFMIENYTTLGDVKNWLKEAKDKKLWLNIVFHQVDNSQGEYSALPEFLIQITKAINESNLEVVLPSQVLEIK